MAALAYLVLPISGLLAVALGSQTRTRFHGMQAIVVGLLWALGLYGASALSPDATKVVFVVGALTWLLLMGATAVGRDPKLPGLGSVLQRAASDDP